MSIYTPKRGTYVSDTDLKSMAEDYFSATVERRYEEEVSIENGGGKSEIRHVNGHVYNSDNPILRTVRIGIVDMGSRKNWLHIEIEQVEGDELQDLIQSVESDTLEEAATAKNGFVKEVTGYSVEDLKDKVEENAKNT